MRKTLLLFFGTGINLFSVHNWKLYNHSSLLHSSLAAYRCRVISKQLYPTTEKRKFHPLETRHLNGYSDGTAGWATDKSWFHSLQRQETFLFPVVFRPATGTAWHPSQLVPTPPSPGVKSSGRETDHLQLMTGLKMCRVILPFCNDVFMPLWGHVVQ
jgi:hypothetical protein